MLFCMVQMRSQLKEVQTLICHIMPMLEKYVIVLLVQQLHLVQPVKMGECEIYNIVC